MKGITIHRYAMLPGSSAALLFVKNDNKYHVLRDNNVLRDSGCRSEEMNLGEDQ